MAGLVIVAISYWGGEGEKTQVIDAKPISTVSKGGWVEIFSGKAEIFVGNDTRKELLNGDIVGEGDNIEISKDAKVSIHLFDGSILRASDGAKFSIKSAEFDKASGKLVLEASLSSGKIWSKIIELATPDSLWKVETSNTVATVRGSAFGVSTDGKISEVFGSQHKVYVDLIDPVGKNKVKKDSIVIEEDSSFKITNENIEKVKKIEEKISSTTPPATLAKLMKESESLIVLTKKGKDNWISANETADKIVEEEIKTIKEESGGSREEFIRILNEKVEEKLNEVKSKNEGTPEGTDGAGKVDNEAESGVKEPSVTDTNKIIKVEPKQEAVKAQEALVQKEVDAVPEKWTGLKIETLSDISNVTEGEMISFRAVLRGENGGEKDVTKESKWQVLGQMGVMERAGTFAAKLDPSIAEYGEAVGYIVATWQGASGEQLLGKSGEVRVSIKIDNGPAQEEIFIGQ